MELKLLKRKSWSDESGVSEIVGNILILMITVVLFSGIMMFVNQMPVPEMTTKADFSASVAYADGGTTAVISITHVGGASMRAAETVVLVSIDQMTYSYRLSEANANFSYAEWATGLVWSSERYSGTTYYSSMSVTVIDDASHNAVWTSQVSGGMGNTPPSVLQRYVDSNNQTLSADPLKENDNFTLFVKIADLDNDLEAVWVDSTSLVVGSPMALPNRPLTGVSPLGGWFEWDFINVAKNVTDVDGKVLVIYARDAAGHTTIVPYKLSVIVLPSNTVFVESPESAQEGGMPSYIKNANEGQGFAIFGELLPTKTANTSDPRTTFTRGEMVFIRAASTYVTNLDAANDLWITDVRTNLNVTYQLTFYGSSTVVNPFYRFPFGGNVALYEAVFNTTGMMPGTYTMHAVLSCTGLTNYNFVFEQTLYINDPEFPLDYYPKVWTSNQAAFSHLWGTTKVTTFNATSANYMMYVAISVQDTQDVVTSPISIGEVRVVDMTGGTQLYGPPNSMPMITSVQVRNETAYYFGIDLRYHNGDAWKIGTNSYTLRISQFSDNNEGVYTYSTQVFVRASSSRADFMVGTNGLYSSLGGSTNFISPEYLYYIENNNFFTMRTLYYQENAPSTSPLYYHNAMALGDLDNDGDLDLLVGSNMDRSGAILDSGRLLYFENTMNTYGIWQSPAVIMRPDGDTVTTKIRWIDTGDINGDKYTDFAYVTSQQKVWLYNNTYGAQGREFNPVGFSIDPNTKDGVRKLALRDMNGDGRADLILLKEGKVVMYDLSKWTSAYFAIVPNATIVSDIRDFDIADVNCDGMLDIITVDTDNINSNSAIRGVWLNNYTPKNPDDVNKKLLLTADDKTLALAGIADGTVALTHSVDGQVLRLMENSTGPNNGSVSFIFTVDTPLSAYSDQQLVVRAGVTSGTKEVFYVWYSTDINPLTAKFTPIMVISGSTIKNYTFDLPANKAGAQYMYVKITDSSTSLGEAVEALSIDYIAVHSDRFGSYSGDRCQVTLATDGYTTARAFNFDGLGDNRLEVVVAKDGKFAVYDVKVQAPYWTLDNLYVPSQLYGMYVKIPTGITGYSTISTTAPTLFSVADINGDGLDDIVTCWVSTGASNEISVLKAYVNVGWEVAPWSVTIKDLFYGMVVGTEKGCIVSIAVGDIYGRTS